MRVLLLVTDAYGGHGGIAYYNRCLAEALQQMPEVTEVVVVPRVTRFTPAAIPAGIRFVASAAGSKWRFLRAVARLCKESFDLLICGHVNLLPLAAPLAALLRVPLVLQVHGIDVWRQPSPLTRFLVRHVGAVWSVSAVTRDRMNTWAALPLARYTVMPNTVRLERFGLAPRRADLVARYRLEGRKVIMTLARLAGFERYKGIDEILNVMPALLAIEPAIVYVVAGDGDDQHRLETRASALGIADHVVFAGYVDESEKADFLRLADVFALPGRGEGFGIVYLEALACGVPVVGSQLDGSREALRDGALGELANPADPDSVRGCIVRALAKPRAVPAGLDYFAWPHFQERVSAAARALVAA